MTSPMMQRRAFVLGGVAALALLPRAARAQDEPCPEGLVCVTFPEGDPDGVVIEFDPAQGDLQSICVAERVTTITSFSGTFTTQQVTIADFLANGGTFELREERTVDREGAFAEASLGDVFTLREVEA